MVCSDRLTTHYRRRNRGGSARPEKLLMNYHHHSMRKLRQIVATTPEETLRASWDRHTHLFGDTLRNPHVFTFTHSYKKHKHIPTQAETLEPSLTYYKSNRAQLPARSCLFPQSPELLRRPRHRTSLLRERERTK